MKLWIPLDWFVPGRTTTIRCQVDDLRTWAQGIAEAAVDEYKRQQAAKEQSNG